MQILLTWIGLDPDSSNFVDPDPDPDTINPDPHHCPARYRIPKKAGYSASRISGTTLVFTQS